MMMTFRTIISRFIRIAVVVRESRLPADKPSPQHIQTDRQMAGQRRRKHGQYVDTEPSDDYGQPLCFIFFGSFFWFWLLLLLGAPNAELSVRRVAIAVAVGPTDSFLRLVVLLFLHRIASVSRKGFIWPIRSVRCYRGSDGQVRASERAMGVCPKGHGF